MSAIKRYQRSLVWIRRDLRLQDHRALAEACLESKEVAVVFVFDQVILQSLNNPKDARITFIHETLREIDEELREAGSALIVLQGDPVFEIPAIAKKLQAEAVFYNEDYEPYAKNRDEKIREKLWQEKIDFNRFKDQVIFAGYELKKPDGSPYQVFTPYKNAWLKKCRNSDLVDCQLNKPQWLEQSQILNHYRLPTIDKIGFKKADFFYDFQRPGRKNAVKTLQLFLNKIQNYDDDRNFPSIEGGTSGLSVHLRFGTVSVRECLRACQKLKNKGAQTWISELIWRDFYHMILDQFPHVANKSFKARYEKIQWPGKEEHFQAWCQGKTGFPLVDAAMKQLNESGFMHNRLRMVTASFLVKDLLIDWRRGEQYFAEKLLDFDLAANNGGWQWSASTGCDAQPYFRIFHPLSQSKKFDSQGQFIRHWLPQLKTLSDKEIHFPDPLFYLAPIVDHAQQRLLALKLFKEL